MNKRQRKKWLKQHGQYIPESELWNFDSTICEWIIPRLKKFKEINIAYPGTEEIPTPEAWDEILDKMIHGFEMASIDPMTDDRAGLDLFDENCHLKVSNEEFKKRVTAYEKEQDECLMLFVKYFDYLWI